MELLDIIFIASLIFCICFGYFYRKINDLEKKKWIGDILGLLLIICVSGIHIYITIISWFISTIIIKFFNVRRSHLLCLVFQFSYLLLCRIIFTPPSQYFGLIQMFLTLKIVGLAFEKNTAYLKSKAMETAKKDDPIKKLTPIDKELLNLNFADSFHYCFNYIGIVTGPYYNYRTFRDYLHLPYCNYANCTKATIDKIKYVPLYAVLCVLFSYFFPSNYLMKPEFYSNHTILYRLMYALPIFITYRTGVYTAFTLSECVCTMAGFGAYPKQAKSNPGSGPTKEYLNLLSTPESFEYDFETVHNITPYVTETSCTYKDCVQSWNMCVKYWMIVNIYCRIPQKNMRSLGTLLISALWHGTSIGYYIYMIEIPFYIHAEDLYHTIIRDDASGLYGQIVDIIFWMVTYLSYAYMAITFSIPSWDQIWNYYGSVYYLGHILWLIMLSLGTVIDLIKKQIVKSKID